MSKLLDLIGNTPMVELNQLSVNKNVTIYGKLEGTNPGGSVKDRAAYGMIRGAIERGEITKGIKLIEATSGNTGIALAMIANLFNIDIELVMPEDATRERVLTMQAFGAKVILTPKAQSMEGSIDYAKEQVEKGEMPLGSYTIIHKNAILNEDEKKLLLNWVEMTRSLMRQKYPADSLVTKREPRIVG